MVDFLPSRISGHKDLPLLSSESGAKLTCRKELPPYAPSFTTNTQT